MLYSFYKCILITQLEEFIEDSFKNKFPGQWCHHGLSFVQGKLRTATRESCLSWAACPGQVGSGVLLSELSLRISKHPQVGLDPWRYQETLRGPPSHCHYVAVMWAPGKQPPSHAWDRHSMGLSSAAGCRSLSVLRSHQITQPKLVWDSGHPPSRHNKAISLRTCVTADG